MGARVMFLFWTLLAIFIIVPILNTVSLLWTESGGVLDQTFNASDAAAWNTTGEILTANQTARIGMTTLEVGVMQFYVPSIIVFLVIIVFYVLGKAWTSRGEGGMEE